MKLGTLNQIPLSLFRFALSHLNISKMTQIIRFQSVYLLAKHTGADGMEYR